MKVPQIIISVFGDLSLTKAKRIWSKLYKDLLCQEFPLQWEKLISVDVGNEVGYIQADLYFQTVEGNLFPVIITGIYVDEKFNPIQYGTNYGNLVY
jgi:hypothetical protein